MTTATPTRESTPARRGGRDPRTVELSPRGANAYGALSSDGVTIYSLRLVAGLWTCTCPGFSARRTCCHALAAALPRCYWCESTANVSTYINGWDRGAEITLCSACFSPKEVA